MDDPTVIIVLRLVHIVIGAFWVGGAVITGFFLLPTVLASGQGGSQFVGNLMRRTRLTDVLMWAGVLVILSGAGLYWRAFRDASWTGFDPPVVFGAGGALAVVALAIGVLVARPTAGRLAALGREIQAQGAPPTAAQLQDRDSILRRLMNIARLNAVLLLLAVASMAVGRYA